MLYRSFLKPAAVLSLASLLLGGLGCRNAVDPRVAEATKPFVLTMWGVFDDTDAYDKIIDAYKAKQPHVRIEYKKFRPEEYETALLNALAEDKGPDIFMVRNTAVPEWQSKILPIPETVQVPVREVKGTVQKRLEITLQDVPTISLRQLQNNFVDVVAGDVVLPVREPTESGGSREVTRIWGLPLSVDTLALYYNRTLLNRAGIPEPPKTWLDMQAAAKNTKLTVFDASQRVTQASVALGTANNVERSMDVLQLLMMQNGARMATPDGNVTFPNRTQNHVGDLSNAAEATIFYTDFANPVKEVYTWNEAMPNSLEAFVGGKAAMFVGYAYHLPLIRARAPKLEFGIAPIPQIREPIAFANYWVHTVSKKTTHGDIAWDFVQFMASPEQATVYLKATGKPTALKSLISSQEEDVDLGVFAQQTLIAQNWYHGKDSKAMEQAFKTLITSTLADPTKVTTHLKIAAEQVAQNYR